jgi:8-oxo-dGTP pyrophosphatase MutT (NUDIX family)
VALTGILSLVVSLDAIRAALAAHPPRLRHGTRRAAVAVVVCERGPHAEMLFIERARRLGDPWSGHMAFPGGRVDPGDRDERAAAERETREEVGLDLRDAEPFGRLDDLYAGVPMVASLVLSAFVYRTDRPPPLVPNHEVRTALWVPIPALVEPARHIPHRWGLLSYPGILVGEPGRHVVWGLTYQLLEGLFERIGMPFASAAAGRTG